MAEPRDDFEERERLQITLASIGDAVISTDAGGRIVFLNRVAETLTGWSHDEAIGKAIDDVFRIINEETRLPVDNPALRAFAEARTVELANHTLLIDRHGGEKPIDDSAAPMRDAAGKLIGSVLVFRDVSERQRLDLVQARLAAIIQSSDDAIISKTLDGFIQSWNSGAERLFGYTAEEAIGRHITLIIPSDRIEEERQILDRLRRGERVEHFETVRLGKEGRQLNMSLTVSPIKDREGRIVGASKIGRDITERKRAEALLQEAQAQKSLLLELRTSTQHLIDPKDVMTSTARLLVEHFDVDRCAYAEIEDESIFVITGDYSRKVPSIVGRWPVAAFGEACVRCMLTNEPFVVNDVDRDVVSARDREAYRATNIRAVICVPLHKAGKFVAAMAVHQTTARAWTLPEIDLMRTVVSRCWESLERARVADGLRETAERLSLAVQAAQLGDWSWDAKNDIVNFSPRAGEIFGLGSGPVMSWAQMREMIHPEDREAARIAVERAMSERTQYDVDYRIRKSTGEEVWVSAKGRAQYLPSGEATGMYGVVQDITEGKRLERELKERVAELAISAKQKDEFIALLAHELRNPLAPLRSGLQVMRLGAADASAVASARAMMDRQLSHMVRLIDDLLDVSRMNQNKLYVQRSKVLLSEVVGHAVESAGPAIEAAQHRLHLTLPAEPVMLHADLTRLSQVFGNLLSNSAKYTENGGDIWVTAETQGGFVRISVRDNGLGIPSDSLLRVFDMFSQVNRSIERTTGGLGIGLALVKALVEAHEGTVVAESPGLGKGSTFTVRLPVLNESKPPAPAGDTVREDSAPAATKILVVDDNHDAAASLAELLELLGHVVQTAHDGASAVIAAERQRPDLVLMDVGMPGIDGLEATRRIRAETWGKSMTIVALTGWGKDADRERTKSAGCDAHLVKPVSLPELQKVLDGLRSPVVGAEA